MISQDLVDGCKRQLDKDFSYYSLRVLEEKTGKELRKLPFSIRILLENALRNFDGKKVTPSHIESLLEWSPSPKEDVIPYFPSRTVLQDFTGIPLIVDLAAMRDAIKKEGGDPSKINPLIPTDLVIDHSVQVDSYGNAKSIDYNINKEYQRNFERYQMIKWAQQAFENFRVIPPGSGIVHQINLEYLSPCVGTRQVNGETLVFPDTVVGTDSHTTMINGLGVIGWGVGGIEAEAVLLGEPYFLTMPEVVGCKLTGRLPEGATATDLVLTVTNTLRNKGVVGKFVEFFGSALKHLSLADRATVSNMCPEYGATIGFFPVDGITLDYLRQTGRDEEHVNLVEKYCREQMMFNEDDDEVPMFSEIIEIDLSAILPSVAGPSNPDDLVSIDKLKKVVESEIKEYARKRSEAHSIRTLQTHVMSQEGEKEPAFLSDGSLVIAAITSCTNTSNPSVMIAAGLVAKKALDYGLKVPDYVKTSFAPGSRVVTQYLTKLGLQESLNKLGFNVVGYGCTTCIGNSGPLIEPLETVVKDNDLYVTSVLSGNRNFSGRVHPLTRGNFLASPPLVVVYALAGKMGIDLTSEPIGVSKDNKEIYLRDLWPTSAEIKDAIAEAISPEIFRKEYDQITKGDMNWLALKADNSLLYNWDAESTYIRSPPFFDGFSVEKRVPENITGARTLLVLRDKISTDHISPAGKISLGTPASSYLEDRGVYASDFNTYGSRRGNHEVMMRGTFANVQIKNQLLKGEKQREGGWTEILPQGDVKSVYEASMHYLKESVPTVVLGAKNYGVGSSRDWAAKGPRLLGIQAVIVKDYERIHRANLIGMGVLPLQFLEGEGWEELGLTGEEKYEIYGIEGELTPLQDVKVRAEKEDGSEVQFTVKLRIDIPIEVDYYLHGGILPYVLSEILSEGTLSD